MKVSKLYLIGLTLLSFFAFSEQLEFDNHIFDDSFNKFLTEEVRQDFYQKLSPEESKWLAETKSIDVGVVAPLTPPFGLVTSHRHFGGISAELFTIFKIMTGVNVNIHYFRSEHEVLDALSKNKIQLVNINSFSPVNAGNLTKRGDFSSPVMLSDGLYLKKDAQNQDIELAQARIAYERGSLDDSALQQLYPEATLIPYEKATMAFDAVLFGDADYLVANRLVGRYLNGSRFGNLILKERLPLEGKPLSFFVSHSHPHLLSIVNNYVDVFKSHGLYSLLDLRWRGGMGSEAIDISKYISFKEYDALRDRDIRVGLVADNLPFSFVDNKGNWQGILVDILEHISIQTGLRFTEVEVDNFSIAEKELIKGRVDIIGVLSSNFQHDDLLSSVYFNSDDLLVEIAVKNMPKGSDIVYGAASANRFDVMNSSLSSTAKDSFLYFDTDQVVLQQLELGKINKAIVSLYTAEYYKRLSQIPFHILGPLNGEHIERSFAVRNSDTALLALLNASLSLTIPSDISAIGYKWRYGEKPHVGYWAKYEYILLPIISSIGVLLLVYVYYSYRLARALKWRKKAEVKLSSQLVLMQGFINGIPHPVVLIDSAMNIVFRNNAFDSEFELSKEINVSNLNDILSSDDCYNISKRVSETLASGKVLTNELNLTVAGSSRDIQDWFIPYEDITDGSKGVFWGWFDVTWRNNAYAIAMQARSEAEQANRAKSEFIATISHEIRTPLNIINGFLELLSTSTSLTAAEHQELLYMRNASNSLLELVGDVLDVTKIESGLMTINLALIDVYALLQDAVDVFKLASNAKGVDLIANFEIDSPCWGMFDALRFRQVFYNILSNAVKFTHQGKITVSVKILNGTLYVTVKDTGIGIASDKLNSLFKPFVQAHVDGETKGSGLGLNIGKRLCELMGGNISISSVKGEGTTIDFNLPYICVSAPSVETIDTPVVESRKCTISKIIIVDDHPINLLLLEKQLSSIGYQVIKMDEAAKVIDCLKENRVDMIITDCQMPDVDGFELSRMIREYEQANNLDYRHIIIGLTASGLESDVHHGIASGMDDCLFKPIDIKMLRALLAPYQDVASRVVDSASTQKADNAKQADNAKRADTVKNSFLVMARDASLQDLALARQALAAFDIDKLSSHIHRIKGVYLMLGNHDVTSICKNIEENITGHQDRYMFEKLFDDIENLINEEDVG